MTRIGFVQANNISRIAVRNCQGDKVGYLASERGKQVFRAVDGQLVATIKRFKNDCAPSRLGACGGSFAPPDWW